MNKSNSKNIFKDNVNYRNNVFDDLFLSHFKNLFLSDFFDIERNKFVNSSLSEDETNFYIETELPGVKKEDINIEIENGNRIFIKAERKKNNFNSKKDDSSSFHSFFSKNYDLNSIIKENEIKANFENGVLYLIIPKDSKSKISKINID